MAKAASFSASRSRSWTSLAAPGVGEHLGVARLVVVGGKRIGHQDRRMAGDGDLRQTGGAGARDHQIRHGIGGRHLIAETEHLVARTTVGDGGNPLEIEGSGDVQHLGVRRQVRGGLGAEFVEAPRSLAAAGDEDRGFVRIEPEPVRRPPRVTADR